MSATHPSLPSLEEKTHSILTIKGKIRNLSGEECTAVNLISPKEVNIITNKFNY